MSDTTPPADPWAPVQHEDAAPEPEPTPEKPIKVAAHTRAPSRSEPKTEPAHAPATLPLALSVAVPTDLMEGIRALIESQKAVIAKIDTLLGKIGALADARSTEPDTQPSLPGLQ